MSRLNLLVIAGGRSAERDVSLISAAAVIKNASPKRYAVRIVHIDARGRWFLVKDLSSLAQGRPLTLRLGERAWLRSARGPVAVDAVFPVLHGPMGEDGTIQGLFELAGVPYVGCDVAGSAVGMDKALTKKVAAQAGLPLLPYAVIQKGGSLAEARKLKLPVFVKPAKMGSSVGVHKVKRASELERAVKAAFAFDTVVVVEQGVEAREIECAVLGTAEKPEASVPGEIRPQGEFYDYETKYLRPERAPIVLPAELSAARTAEIQRLAKTAFTALGLYGLARVDFLMDKRTGKLWFNEPNTLPGFTANSLYPRMWEASGLPFPKLVDRLVDLALQRQRARAALRVLR